MPMKIAQKMYNCIFVRLWQTTDSFLGVYGRFTYGFYDKYEWIGMLTIYTVRVLMVLLL